MAAKDNSAYKGFRNQTQNKRAKQNRPHSQRAKQNKQRNHSEQRTKQIRPHQQISAGAIPNIQQHRFHTPQRYTPQQSHSRSMSIDKLNTMSEQERLNLALQMSMSKTSESKSQPSQPKPKTMLPKLTYNDDNIVQHKWRLDMSHKQLKHASNKADDDVKYDMKESIAVLMIGNTGTGKSSIIQLLSGKKVKVSRGSERGTNDVSTIQSKYHKNIYFIDTIGLQDSNTDWTDDQLLKRSLQYIHHEGFSKIKIIFCVSGDTNCRKGPFYRSARFIGSWNKALDEESDDDENYEQDGDIMITPSAPPSIWTSVLIVKKNGYPQRFEDVSGVLSAARENGASNSIRSDRNIFGFTCTDWDFDKAHPLYEFMEGKNSAQLRRIGLFTKLEARHEINNKLEQLPCYKLKFKKEICKRCGTKGDSRYISALCHTKPDWFHDAPMSYYHPGQKQPKHAGKLNTYKSMIKYYHPQQKRSVHRGKMEKYHPGIIVNKGSADFKFSLVFKKKDFKFYDCCNKSVKKAAPCANRWSCCKADESVIHCLGTGMDPKWTCCGGNSTSPGCVALNIKRKMYSCCKQPEGQAGCIIYWSCCGDPGRGCEVKYACCDGDINSKGCKQKCVNCKTNWGKPTGCIVAK